MKRLLTWLAGVALAVLWIVGALFGVRARRQSQESARESRENAHAAAVAAEVLRKHEYEAEEKRRFKEAVDDDHDLLRRIGSITQRKP